MICVSVKIVLMPSGQVVTLACTLGQTLQQLKDHFSQELKMPGNLILMMFDGKIFFQTKNSLLQDYKIIVKVNDHI